MDKSIFYEPSGPALFNRWTAAHVGVGAISKREGIPLLAGVILHTIYEAHEDKIFKRFNRDKSMLNHVGDTVAFIAGYLI